MVCITFILFQWVIGLTYIIVDNKVMKESSWWPQMHRWNYGGRNVGLWTTACESWFRRRLNGLNTPGKGYDVRSSSDWVKALNLYKDTTRMIKRNEENSHNFLLSLLKPS